MSTSLITLLLAVFTFAPSTNKKRETPPGTVEISEGYYADITEISNISWLEYVYWLKQKHGEDSEVYHQAYPDSTVWSEKYGPYSRLYFQHPAYRDYPLVGITLEQAQAYCEWRSARVNEMLYIRDHKIDYVPGETKLENIPQIYRYRLPTKKEWEALAAIPFTDKTLKRMAKAEKKNENQALKNYGGIAPKLRELETTAPIYANYPNAAGLYNLEGNVSELVVDETVPMGGHWQKDSLSNEAELDAAQKPSNWMGFRCVAEKVGQ